MQMCDNRVLKKSTFGIAKYAPASMQLCLKILVESNGKLICPSCGIEYKIHKE